MAYMTHVLFLATFAAVSLALGLQLGELSNCPLNTAWASPFSPPRYYQINRGTCWAFATIGLLEESYRANGVQKGFLEPNQYVRLSEQAFGKAMVDQCAKHPEVCNDLGDFVVEGSTEGGEVYWLYLFPEMYTQVLPHSVCPYPEESSLDTDTKCDGYDDALKTNPIKFEIKNMVQTYNAYDTRKFMLENQKPMVWSVFIHDSYFYYPCTADSIWSNHELCSEAKRVRCPTDQYYNAEFCAAVVSPMYNPDGEFFGHGNLYPDGGHAMVAVGFNDNYVSKTGSKGGFIIKNSWYDKSYPDAKNSRGVRGSHSIQYLMMEISEWDERKICPNPENPNHWASCTTVSMGPTRKTKLPYKLGLRNKAPRNARGEIDLTAANYDLDSTCLNDKYMDDLVNVYYTPSEFVCLDATWCDADPRYRYFLIDMVRSVDGWLLQVNMLQYDTITKAQTVVSLPPMHDGMIPFVFGPTEKQKETLTNAISEDLCGYYFWPYELLDKQVGLFGGFSTQYFDIEWADQSYLVNNRQCASCDYTLLRESQSEQATYSPISTNPWNTVRYDVDE